ncbi:MAG: amidase [Betaproteobacteria bacterium]|nr:amidase [Betaproteobacteria bacterium]
MKRRTFLAAGTALAAAGAGAAAGTAGPQVGAGMDSFELAEVSAAGIQQRIAQGDSALAIAQRYLARIAAVDQAGPALRSVIEINPQALEIAAQCDADRRAGRPRGPLHGVPVLIKDNIATADAMQTTAGSLALVGGRAPRDAFVVQRLRAAGAVVLGKTNLSEWANFRGQRSISGWSARGGQTRNPYALDRSPSGSSSGSAAALAANLGALGVGTETDGSITSPSAVNGLVGVKPTLGLVSRDGIVPIAFSQDTAGPMCRTVADAALLLAAMAGVDARDAATARQKGRIDVSSLQVLRADALRGVRIGVARNLAGYHRRTDVLFDAALLALRDAGAVLVDPAPLPNVDKYRDSELEVLLYELGPAMAAYLREFAPNLPYRTLGDLIAFNRAHAADELALFGQEWFEQANAKGPLTDAAYRKALATGHRYARTYGIDAVLRQHRLAAIVAPTSGPAWLIDPINGDASGDSATSPAAVAGYPHVTVPMGQVSGLPVGLSFIGTAWSDVQLLQFAYAFEQATKLRRAPTFALSAG